MKLDLDKMQNTNGYFQGDLECVAETLRNLPFEYKKRLSQSFLAILPEQINYRVSGTTFYVSKKLDGHLQLLVFNGEQAYIIGRGGIVRTGLPCLEQAVSSFREKGITSLIAAAELYYFKEDGRSRVYDVTSALADQDRLSNLRLACFDLLELDGESFKTVSYENVYQKLAALLPVTGPVHLIPTTVVKSKEQISQLFEKWVGEEGHEGLVVRSELAVIFKIKPKYTFDAVVIGYAEGINEHKGKVKSLLLAFRKGELYQVGGKVGNIPEEDRQKLYDIFSQKHVASRFIETDNEGIAFHMVEPDTVIEVSCNDLITESSNGKPLLNQVLAFSDSVYTLQQTVPGVRFINLVWERIRDDKLNHETEVGFAQINDLVELPNVTQVTAQLPSSQLIFREVYQKVVKDKVMVQKFLVWKTNKETLDSRYPAYVMHYTNFSSQRKTPLEREVRISNSEEQIMALVKDFIAANVKSGWNLVN
ncbi:MAG TPA: hypothetical protein PLZ08_03275 [Bacillota bacterium]|jgi:ATP-dependent DNA ligase|nr:hypothetical protein [Bacillota bacterium]HOL08557.1 hypothetical protein [Bacillota bacterium]HPO96962.1 hypothetical protein [Bacillota bacterium]